MDPSGWVRLVVAENQDEDVVWNRHIASILAGLPDNVLRICRYGLTEMFNKVIDHSEAEFAYIRADIVDNEVRVSVADDGVGIFAKIMREFGLENLNQAIFELSKGVTTDPTRHSGQGIFFTSRAFDTFTIVSSNLLFGHPRHGDDWLMEKRDRVVKGTVVAMDIDTDSTRSLKDVFDEHSSVDEGFYRTHIQIDLAKAGDSELISRSQAKRVLARCEKFKEIVLDFVGVDFIGQAFADEIFRVFLRQNPDVTIRQINANDQIISMINNVQKWGGGPLEQVGRAIDQNVAEWTRTKMSGTPEERAQFLEECYRGARYNGRIAILGAPALGKTHREAFATLPVTFERNAAQEARDAGLDEEQTLLYFQAYRKAYESLAEEFGFK